MKKTCQRSAPLVSDLAQQLPGAAGVDAHRFGPTPGEPPADSEEVPVVSSPNHVIAASTSLSPRPDRLTKINRGSADAAGARRGPSLSAPANACADSIAGTIPSVLESNWKASIASASLIGS